MFLISELLVIRQRWSQAARVLRTAWGRNFGAPSDPSPAGI